MSNRIGRTEAVVVAVLLLAMVAQAQMSSRDLRLMRPLSLSGTLTGGYYMAETKNGHFVRQSSPLGSARFDLSGFLHSPDFLRFNIKPQGSLGTQSSETIFPDGQGVYAGGTFMGGGVAPLTVSFNRINRKLVTFGPMDRLAGLEAKSHQDSLGINWRLRLNHLPELTLNFSKYNDTFEPLQALTSKSENHSRLFAAGLEKDVLGWKLQSQLRVDRSAQTLLNIFDPAQPPYFYKRNSRDLTASASRDFNNVFGLNFHGGRSENKTEVAGLPLDQSYNFINGNSYFRGGEKLTANLRAGVTSNLIGASVRRYLEPDGLTPTQPSILVPGQARIQLFTIAGQAQYALTRDLRIEGDVRRENTRAPRTSELTTPETTLTSVQAGLGYGHNFRRWSFQTHYAANTGRFNYTTTGESATRGHTANLSLSFGSPGLMELTASAQGHIQKLRDHINVDDIGWSSTFSATRQLVAGWTLRATYNREKNTYEYGISRYDADGQGLTLALANHIGQFSATHQRRQGLSLQMDPRFQFVSSSAAVALQEAFPTSLVIPTQANWSNVTGSVNLGSRFTARGAWMRSRQSLEGRSVNNYTDWEASLGYKFRNLTFDLGYIWHDQDFGAGLFTRNRFFFRVVREFTLF